MTRSEILLRVNALHCLIVAGRSEEAALYYTPSVALYFPERLLVVRGRDDMACRLGQYHQRCQKLGIRRIACTDLVIMDTTPCTTFVALFLNFLQADGHSVVSSQLNYVLRQDDADADLQIELVEVAAQGALEVPENLPFRA